MKAAVEFKNAKDFWSKGQNTKAVKYLIGELAETVKTSISGTTVSFLTSEKADEAQAFLISGGWNVYRITERLLSCGMD